MTSLYRRATERERRVLRIVEGACRNAGHHHPELNITPRGARSIAKRVTGTLVPELGTVLALPHRGSSQRDAGHTNTGVRGAGTVCDPASGDVTSHASPLGGAPSPGLGRPPSLSYLHRVIGHMAGDAKRSGDTARLGTLRDVLRVVAALRDAPRPPPRTFDWRMALRKMGEPA